MVICLECSADLHIAQLMPLPLTVSCFSKIQIGFTFLVPAHLGSPGQRAVKWVCVCVCVVVVAVGLHCVELIYCWCCCQMLDGDYYERVKDFLTSLAGAEQTCASTANDCFQRVTSDASKVNLFSAY